MSEEMDIFDFIEGKESCEINSKFVVMIVAGKGVNEAFCMQDCTDSMMDAVAEECAESCNGEYLDVDYFFMRIDGGLTDRRKKRFEERISGKSMYDAARTLVRLGCTDMQSGGATRTYIKELRKRK